MVKTIKVLEDRGLTVIQRRPPGQIEDQAPDQQIGPVDTRLARAAPQRMALTDGS